MIRCANPRCERLMAYWNAAYRFEEQGRRRTLRFVGPSWVGESTQPTDARGSWAIITACNPMSQPQSAADNLRRGAELIGALDRLGLAHGEADNAAPDGSWPEPGRVVADIDRGTLLALARRFGQAAVVWRTGGRAGLLETATERWVVRKDVISG